MSTRTLLCQVVLFFSCCTFGYGQMPFDCNGRSYRVLAASNGTYLQEINQTNSEQTISFTNLHFFQDQEINAIAYHPTQNVIYGVLQTPPYRLCRIDAAFNLEVLKVLPLSTDLVFVSGDISPDEKHLVLFGFGDTNFENIVALVDIQNGTFDTQVLPLQTSNPLQPYIYCADIAFHPTTNKLFGFDYKNGRLVTLDIPNRLIDNEIYPLSSLTVGNVPSIFFTAKGELYGIGTNIQEMTENRAYYHFDLLTGQPDLLQEMEIEKNQDACSCPYKINLLNEVGQRMNAPCTDLVFEITLINRTDLEHADLVLEDTFPQGTSIKSISPLPFDGAIESGLGSNKLVINNLNLPIGTFTIEVILDIDQNISLGNYENQSILTGFQLEEIGISTVLSDDPKTAIPNDPTQFSVDALLTSIDEEFFGICQGGTATLHAGFYGANSYEWSTGETTDAITVHSAGDYQVTIVTDCDQTIGTATVTLDDIDVEIGKDRTIESGETVNLQPVFTSHSPIKSFHWQTNNSQELKCPSCKNLQFQPWSDTEVQLSIENATGCQSKDQLELKVADIAIYTANAFSPNKDNLNDYFFLQGNLPFTILEFQIFDRWGSLLYQKKNILANQSQMGWDGTHNDRACSAGVYVWTAIVKYKSGNEKILSGDVTLIR